MSGKSLAVVNDTSPLASIDSDWDRTMLRAETYVQSGLLPTSIKTPQQAIVIIETGRELGIPPMLALRSIHVINGRPTLSADLMASLVQHEIDRHKDGELRVLPPTAESCSVHYRRWGWREGHVYTYAIQDAQRAGLTSNDNYKKHPASMLRARATAAVCRMAFPDVVAGLYAPEEIDEEETPGSWPQRSATVTSRADPVEPRADDRVAAFPRVDVVEARVRGIPLDHDDVTDDEIIDADTGEITGQQALPEDLPTNGIDMISAEQRGRILFLARKIGWLTPDKKDVDMPSVNGFAGEATGISNIDLLSFQRAAYVIQEMEGQVPSRARAS